MWAGTISRITKHAEKISKRDKKALAKLSSTMLAQTEGINETMNKVDDTQNFLKREFTETIEKVDSNGHGVNRKLDHLNKLLEKVCGVN